MQDIILIVHVVVAVCLIALVLLQQGRGAATGAAFGGGASQSVFGSRGSTPFLSKVTTLLAILFFASSLLLARLAMTPQATYSQEKVEQQKLSIPVNEVQDVANDTKVPTS